MTLSPRADVPLAPLTTLEVGGPARWLAEVAEEAGVVEALRWADEAGCRVEVLGGGSNVLVADRGLDALVLRLTSDRIVDRDGVVDVDAGVGWDRFVAWAVERGYAGIECLSGIPGDVGAAPMQNVGAYGQDVSETIEEVVVVDRQSGETSTFDAASCRFGYRDSVFKHEAAGRYVVVRVRFRLRPGGAPKIAYAELERAVRAASGEPTVASVRRQVIALRRNKSMVLDDGDENRRSAGSFFVNLTMAVERADQLADRVAAVLGDDHGMPRFPAGEGKVKVPAAWLIERAGFGKGTARGPVGISTKHSLAIVNRGGATAAQLVAFAAEVRAGVRDRFGASLTPEPRLLGFEPSETAPLFD